MNAQIGFLIGILVGIIELFAFFFYMHRINKTYLNRRAK
jgi:hypothetical protein